MGTSTERTVDLNETALAAAKRASEGYLEQLIDIKPKDQDQYLKIRARFEEAYVIGSLADDPQNSTLLLEEWAKMQRFYANAVIGELKSGQNLDAKITEFNRTIEAHAQAKSSYDTLMDDTANRSTQRAKRLGELAPHVERYDAAFQERESLTQTKQKTQAAVEDLIYLTKLTNDQIIHYTIVPSTAIIENLAQNKYDPPLFSPIATEISDVFAQKRGVTLEELSASEPIFFKAKVRPSILEALLLVRDVIAWYEEGLKFTSSKLGNDARIQKAMQAIDPAYGAGKVGGYVERTPEPFGVRVVREGKIRKFVRLKGPKMDDESFLGRVIPKLPGADLGEINTFYIQRALDYCREQSVGYGENAITAKYILEQVRAQGFPIAEKAVAINLGKGAEAKYGLVKVEGEGKPSYVFKEVHPTERQYQSIEAAVKARDHARFSSLDILESIRRASDNQLLPPAIIETALQNKYKDWGLKLLPGNGVEIQYQRKDAPASARDLKDRHAPTSKRRF